MLKKSIIILIFTFFHLTIFGQKSKKMFAKILSEVSCESGYFIKIKYISPDGVLRSRSFPNCTLFNEFKRHGYSKKAYINYMAQRLSSNKPLEIKDTASILLKSDLGDNYHIASLKKIKEVILKNGDDFTDFFDEYNTIKNQYLSYEGAVAELLWDEGIYLKNDSSINKFRIGFINPYPQTKIKAKFQQLFESFYPKAMERNLHLSLENILFIKFSPTDSLSIASINRNGYYHNIHKNTEGHTIEISSQHSDRKGTFSFEKKVDNNLVLKGYCKANDKIYVGFWPNWSDIIHDFENVPYKYYYPEKVGKWEYYENGKVSKIEQY